MDRLLVVSDLNASSLATLAPLLVLAGGALLTLATLVVHRSRHLVAALTALCAVGSATAVFVVAGRAPVRVTALLIVDGFALFYVLLVCGVTLAVTLLLHAHLGRRPALGEEAFVLLLLAASGAAALLMSAHMAALVLGLETLSVALYGLIGGARGRLQVEAALKYLVLAGVSSALLLFGLALLYHAAGTTDLLRLMATLDSGSPWPTAAVAGTALVLAGAAFKLALVPLHAWAPEVYQGAPLPVTALLATLSKGAVLALLVRLTAGLEADQQPALLWMLAALALASMLCGNLLALKQQNLKRMLAYSSVAHMGYALLALVAGGAAGVMAVGYYLSAYVVTVLAAFGVMSAVCGPGAEGADHLETYRGLLWRRPALAGLLCASMLSLAGMPLTAGFAGKLFVLAASVGAARWTLALGLVLGSVISLYYYLRVVFTLAARPDEAPLPPPGSAPRSASNERTPVPTVALLAVLAVLLVWLGVYPETLAGILAVTIHG